MDFRTKLATSIARSMVTESQKWGTGARLVCEDVEGKNINKAEKFIKEKHPEVIGQKLQDGTVITPRILTQEIRNSFKNARGPVVNGKNTCKFLLGVTRIYFDDLKNDQANFQRNCSKLDSYLGIINGAHADEYDQNLNGLSFDELKTRFESAAKQSVKKDMDSIAQGQYSKNDAYDIVPIDSYEEASKYGEYTDWCVTHYAHMYDNYTHGGIGRFYFCMKKGYQDVRPERGEGCPMDDYGKSMIAISVNDDGSLNTCTCRWNHNNGGNDNMMTTKEISEFFGVNFYETFKPRSIDEIWKSYENHEMRREDVLTKATGWIKIYDDGRYVYAKKGEDRIIKYGYVWNDDRQTVFCVSSDHLLWFNNRGEEIPPQNGKGRIAIDEFPELTSLKGLPEKFDSLNIFSCTELTDVSELAAVTEIGDYLKIEDCPNIQKDQIEKVCQNPVIVKSILQCGFRHDSLPEVNVANGFVNFKIPFDDLERFWTEDRRGEYVSFKTCKRLMQEGAIDDWYDYPLDMDNVDSAPFDNIMSENGIDLTWTEVSDIMEGEYDGAMERSGLSEEQCDSIREMLEDDFYDGIGIGVVNSDCARYGMEAEAQEDIMSAISDKIRTAGTGKFDCWDGENIEASYPIELFANGVRTMWTDKDFSENCNLAEENGIIAFIAARNWEDDDVETISVVEPQYGWSGYSDENWKEAITDFSYRVVKLITGKDPRETEKEDSKEGL